MVDIHTIDEDELSQLVEDLGIYDDKMNNYEINFVDDMSRELSEGSDLTYNQRETLWSICKKVGLDV